MTNRRPFVTELSTHLKVSLRLCYHQCEGSADRSSMRVAFVPIQHCRKHLQREKKRTLSAQKPRRRISRMREKLLSRDDLSRRQRNAGRALNSYSSLAKEEARAGLIKRECAVPTNKLVMQRIIFGDSV